MSVNIMTGSEVHKYINSLDGEQLIRLGTFYNISNLHNIEKLHQLTKKSSAINVKKTANLIKTLESANKSQVTQKNLKAQFDGFIAIKDFSKARLTLIKIITNSKYFTKQNIKVANSIEYNGIQPEVVLYDSYFAGDELQPFNANEEPYINQAGMNTELGISE